MHADSTLFCSGIQEERTRTFPLSIQPTKSQLTMSMSCPITTNIKENFTLVHSYAGNEDFLSTHESEEYYDSLTSRMLRRISSDRQLKTAIRGMHEKANDKNQAKERVKDPVYESATIKDLSSGKDDHDIEGGGEECDSPWFYEEDEVFDMEE